MNIQATFTQFALLNAMKGGSKKKEQLLKTDARILLDSSLNGVRVTTFELTFPRIVLAEWNTHRVMSRNAASSRAIPNKKLIKQCTFEPDVWRLNDKGMQPKRVANKLQAFLAHIVWWHLARRSMIICSTLLRWIGIHKELCNRLMEPWMYVKVIATSTQWDNFFSLRVHKDAQREIRILARRMLEEFMESIPVLREIHIPFVDDREFHSWKLVPENARQIYFLLRRSVACCARVSYLTHDGKNDSDADMQLHDRLLVEVPQHASPGEHQAMTYKMYEMLVNNIMEWNSLKPKKDRWAERIPIPKQKRNDMGGNLSPEIVQYRKVVEKLSGNKRVGHAFLKSLLEEEI